MAWLLDMPAALGDRVGIKGCMKMSDGFSAFLQAVSDRAAKAAVFGPIAIKRDMLVCEAMNSAEPAEYRIARDNGKVWVSVVTANRWLSESIESDLEHTGDEVEELVEEELIELDYTGEKMGASQHYRSEDKLFTFRSPLPIGVNAAATDTKAVETATTCLLAYEACFRRLGDMDAGKAAE